MKHMKRFPDMMTIAEVFKVEQLGREFDSQRYQRKVRIMQHAQRVAHILLRQQEEEREQVRRDMIILGGEQRDVFDAGILMEPVANPEPTENVSPNLVEDEESDDEAIVSDDSSITADGSDPPGSSEGAGTTDVALVEEGSTEPRRVSTNSSSNVTDSETEVSVRNYFPVFDPVAQKKLQSKYNCFGTLHKKHQNFLRDEGILDRCTAYREAERIKIKTKRRVERLFSTMKNIKDFSWAVSGSCKRNRYNQITHVTKSYEYPDPDNHSRTITRNIQIDVLAEAAEDAQRKAAIEQFKRDQQTFPRFTRKPFLSGPFGSMRRQHRAFRSGKMKSYLSPFLDDWYDEFEEEVPDPNDLYERIIPRPAYLPPERDNDPIYNRRVKRRYF